MRPKSIKKEDFHTFLFEFKQIVGHESCMLFLDNLSFHRSLSVKAYCDENAIDLVYNGISSSEFMPIERLWSFAKRNFSRELITTTNYKDERVIQKLIQSGIDEVPPSYISKHVQTCIQRMKLYLEQTQQQQDHEMD